MVFQKEAFKKSPHRDAFSREFCSSYASKCRVASTQNSFLTKYDNNGGAAPSDKTTTITASATYTLAVSMQSAKSAPYHYLRHVSIFGTRLIQIVQASFPVSEEPLFEKKLPDFARAATFPNQSCNVTRRFPEPEPKSRFYVIR